MHKVSRRRLLAWLACPAGLASVGCSTAPAVLAAVAAALAPSGRLRATINLGNPTILTGNYTVNVAAGQ